MSSASQGNRTCCGVSNRTTCSAWLQQNQFRTHWLSAQESKLLSHLGSRYLDVSITREDYPLRFLQRHDHALVDLLGEQAWDARNFAVINLRRTCPMKKTTTSTPNQWLAGRSRPRCRVKAPGQCLRQCPALSG